MLAVVVSRADRASEHVGDHLLSLAEWAKREDDSRSDAEGGGTVYRTDDVELRTFDALHLDLDRAATAFPGPDLLVFASRHSGDTGPLLTAHHTGNFGPAEFGGNADALAEAAPNALARLQTAFREHAPEGYEVGMECTHHGPSEVGVPSLFAELGSSEAEWDDTDGAEAVARAILDLRGVAPHRDRQLVGFGGGHYVPRFERIVRETDWAVGHVAADWALDAMGDPDGHRAVIERAFERSGADVAVVEGDRPDLDRVIADLGYRAVSETWVRETDGVPPDVVEQAEARLGSVEEGVRFGHVAEGGEITASAGGDDGAASRAVDRRGAHVESERETERASEAVSDSAIDGLQVATLPAKLLSAATGIDRERVREAVAARTVAFETADGGTLVDGRVALADAADREALVDALADVLRSKYDEVERRADAVVATRRAFDPAKAHERGVPEGPAFGRLASGEPVEVDGETVTPADVTVEETCQFEL